MRIVVTGASGNVGTALLRRLRADGGHDLVGVARRRPQDSPDHRGVEWVALDLGTPDGAARFRAAVHGADAVVHCAWLLQPHHRPEVMRRANQDGTRHVVEAVAAAGVPHLVHLSSLGAYSPAPAGTTVDETWPTEGVPSLPYSVDKVAAERILDDFEAGAPATTVTRLRPTLVVQPDAGAEIARYFLGPLIPRRLVNPTTVRLLPWPRSLRFQVVHSDDVARAIALLLRERAGGPFNVAAEPVLDRSVATEVFGRLAPPLPPAVLRAVASATWHARLQPTHPGWLDLGIAVPLMDTSRLRALGWQPAHTGTDALREFLVGLSRQRGASGPLLHPEGRA